MVGKLAAVVGRDAFENDVKSFRAHLPLGFMDGPHYGFLCPVF